MVKCSVSNCKNNTSGKNKTEHIKFFRFPKNKDVLNKWISACNFEKDTNINSKRICSNHFEKEDYLLKDQLLNTCFKKCHLKEDSVPTKNLPLPTHPSDRFMRYEKKIQKKLVEILLEDYQK